MLKIPFEQDFLSVTMKMMAQLVKYFKRNFGINKQGHYLMPWQLIARTLQSSLKLFSNILSLNSEFQKGKAIRGNKSVIASSFHRRHQDIYKYPNDHHDDLVKQYKYAQVMIEIIKTIKVAHLWF